MEIISNPLVRYIECVTRPNYLAGYQTLFYDMFPCFFLRFCGGKKLKSFRR